LIHKPTQGWELSFDTSFLGLIQCDFEETTFAMFQLKNGLMALQFHSLGQCIASFNGVFLYGLDWIKGGLKGLWTGMKKM